MSDETKYLVIYADNWADEMDVEGSRIFESKTELDKYFDEFKKQIEDEGYSFGIGTNEEIEYDTFSDFERAFSIHPITDEEIKVLEKFGFESSGQFPEVW